MAVVQDSAAHLDTVPACPRKDITKATTDTAVPQLPTEFQVMATPTPSAATQVTTDYMVTPTPIEDLT